MSNSPEAVVTALAAVYVAILAGALALVFASSSDVRARLRTACLLLIGGGIVPALAFQHLDAALNNRREALLVSRHRAEAARTRFTERCKLAGDKIQRTVAGISGVAILNLSAQASAYALATGSALDATNARQENEYLRSYVRPAARRNTEAAPEISTLAYRYVDIRQSDKWVRYTADSENEPLRPQREANAGQTPLPMSSDTAFAVDYQLIESPEDRESSIRGATVRITELRTHYILAERTFFVRVSDPDDRSSPSSAKATSCPRDASSPGSISTFAKRILRPAK